MQQAWFCFVLFVCALEFFSSGGFSHTLVLLGILLLKAQADSAANRWLKCKEALIVASSWASEKLVNREKNPIREIDPLPPFQRPKHPEPISLDEARKRREAAEKSAKNDQKEPPKSSAPMREAVPNFSGKPHEILLIEPQSPTGQIVHAFRHLMKIYHPDHCQNKNEANEKARKIKEAKETMLRNRRKLRNSA